MAHQEGVLCEEVMLVSESQEEVCVGVKVQARVMGKCRGKLSLDSVFFPHMVKIGIEEG